MISIIDKKVPCKNDLLIIYLMYIFSNMWSLTKGHSVPCPVKFTILSWIQLYFDMYCGLSCSMNSKLGFTSCSIWNTAYILTGSCPGLTYKFTKTYCCHFPHICTVYLDTWIKGNIQRQSNCLPLIIWAIPRSTKAKCPLLNSEIVLNKTTDSSA